MLEIAQASVPTRYCLQRRLYELLGFDAVELGADKDRTNAVRGAQLDVCIMYGLDSVEVHGRILVAGCTNGSGPWSCLNLSRA